MRNRCRAILLVVVSLALCPGKATAQKAPVFGASADLVLIDLLATDSGGRLASATVMLEAP